MKNIMAITWIIFTLFASAGCKNPEIIHVSQDTYILFKEHPVMGWGNLGNLKSEVFTEANAFAESKGKVIEIITTKENPPAFGKYASYELQFRLITKENQEVRRNDFAPPESVLLNTQHAVTHERLVADLNRLIKENAQRVSPGKAFRLAVMPIMQTESQKHVDKGFGAYLTEKITSAIGSMGPSVRLYERSRLDAVIKEQALSSGGLFTETDAKKIGELAPIDFILTGTYTRLEKQITLNARLINVVTGEVSISFTGDFPMSSEFAPLFGNR